MLGLRSAADTSKAGVESEVKVPSKGLPGWRATGRGVRGIVMAIEVTTKDCSSLSDTEFAEMAEMEAIDRKDTRIGVLSKQADAWVLISHARREEELQGFLYSSLERIGGTPALVIGLASIAGGQPSVMRALMHNQFHKARMAFPDEDVVVSARINCAPPLAAFSELDGVRPWPDTRVNGEERAWGRRLAARYKTISYDDRTMVATADGPPLLFDLSPEAGEVHDPVLESCELFVACEDGVSFVIAWGWALAEFLDLFQQPVR